MVAFYIKQSIIYTGKKIKGFGGIRIWHIRLQM